MSGDRTLLGTATSSAATCSTTATMSGPRRRPCGERRLFFFQAEDGIRDELVTGVQTCALPICRVGSRAWRASTPVRVSIRAWLPPTSSDRSEERRVGKECRSRGSPSHYKKKMWNVGKWGEDGLDIALSGHRLTGTGRW